MDQVCVVAIADDAAIGYGFLRKLFIGCRLLGVIGPLGARDRPEGDVGVHARFFFYFLHLRRSANHESAYCGQNTPQCFVHFHPRPEMQGTCVLLPRAVPSVHLWEKLMELTAFRADASAGSWRRRVCICLESESGDELPDCSASFTLCGGLRSSGDELLVGRGGRGSKSSGLFFGS